ncbi:MAG TPA: hypothetical protein PKW55_03070 [Spirochaetota bacterium]|nr:hypothetical protein [Spirochaetota bacterium]HOM38168.1 hypothetical protein [Spirochaetota bacterium]HPQ48614.1 hypothetical protein [Spirochaetota bacterium]
MAFDITKVEKDNYILKIEKEKTNKKGYFYFLFIILSLAAIIYFSNPDTRWVIVIAASCIILSSSIFIFHKYKIVINLKDDTVLIEKKFILSKKTVFPTREIIDYRIKDGESGFLLILVRGIDMEVMVKPEKKYTIFRGSEIKEVEALLKTIKSFVSRETN